MTRLLKIAYIGGGSRGWEHTLMRDLALCPELNGEIRLYDIDMEAARQNQSLGNWLQGQPGVLSSWQYRLAASLGEALDGADFVFISIQPGSLDLMEREIAIAEEHGLYYPVGDSTGFPGLMRGLRSVLIFEKFAHAIARYCPAAWVINYTNPMTVCARTLTRAEPALKVFGCCHEVFNAQEILAEVVQETRQLDQRPARDQIKVNVLGINHFTWFDEARFGEIDLLALLRQHLAEPGVRRFYTQAEVEQENDWFVDFRQVKYELFERFGLLAAAGDRHLCEFLPGLISSPQELFHWGIIRTPVSYRKQRYIDSPRLIRSYLSGETPFDLRPSGEEAVRQVKALLGLGDFVTNVNLPNAGQVINLPLGSVVETNALFSLDSVRPLLAGSLPPGVHGLIATHVHNQEALVEAAMTRNADLAFQALVNDPSITIPLERAWEMFTTAGLPEGW